MKKSMLYLNTSVIFLGTLFSSCSKTDEIDQFSEDPSAKDLSVETLNLKYSGKNDEKLRVFKGPQVQLGEGKIRSWISLDSEDFPVEIGLVMTSEVFNNLEILPESHTPVVLPLHHKAKELTPFEHVGVNWQSAGHLPVFLVKHFDIHFYMITNEERLAIPEYSASTDAAFNLFPPEGYMPGDYGAPPGEDAVYPQMGKHWLPLDLPSYLPFTEIMVLGTYNGEFIFIEPMITLEVLQSNPDFSGAYSQPMYFQETSNYPTTYNIYEDADTGDVYVSLSEFVARQAGE
ncbi:hypothetical protein [Salegentibacter chungangensis]|uniref:DUF5602 domain-containing protein n=1 Tax=Salegentibacter chungangensis TaxID=1335724 RepID=A0ABW3NTL1_9FLAO